MPDNVYHIISAANIQMDTLMKGVAALYVANGGVFGPVFNIDGTKVLAQLKGNFTPPPNIRQASIWFGIQNGLVANLAAAEWQSRIIPPDDLTASYISGSITLGQYLTQVRAITPQQFRIG